MPWIPVSTKCWQQTADQIQNVDQVQNVDCRVGTKCRQNLKRFFVWYLITCHLKTYRSSHSCFSTISFHNYLYYGGIFLAHFLMKIDRNIISSLRIVFSLCARVGWCDVCTDFTNVIKVFKRYVFILLTKMQPRPKLFLLLYMFSTLVDHIILTYLRKSFIPGN